MLTACLRSPPGIEPMPQPQPEPQQEQWDILNLLCHQETAPPPLLLFLKRCLITKYQMASFSCVRPQVLFLSLWHWELVAFAPHPMAEWGGERKSCFVRFQHEITRSTQGGFHISHSTLWYRENSSSCFRSRLILILIAENVPTARHCPRAATWTNVPNRWIAWAAEAGRVSKLLAK